jgi:hypothetical protein
VGTVKMKSKWCSWAPSTPWKHMGGGGGEDRYIAPFILNVGTILR